MGRVSSRPRNAPHPPSPASAEVMTWLSGLAELGCVFLEMVFKVDRATGKTIKKPRRTLDHYKGQTSEKGLASALAWLEKDSPIGIMPRSRLWILDADDAEQVERIVSTLFDLSITPLMVSTRRGAHFYFLLPDDFPMDGLKNAIHVPKFDFIFGPRTVVVAPGSNSKGREYKPAGPWCSPPVLDPRAILPNGDFWEKTDTRPFQVSIESPARRVFGARGYLDHQAPTCVRGTGKGSRTLAKVAAHVCGWYLMKPARATAMMTGPGSWNSRFVDGTGKPTPFSRDEILAACEAAVGKGSEYGRRRWIEEQARQEETKRMEGHIEILKTCLTEPKRIRVPVAEVLEVFSWLGCPDLTVKQFGDALTTHGVPRVRATQRRIWSIERLNFWKMTTAMIEADRLMKQGVKNVCPLVAEWRPQAQNSTEGESLKEQVSVLPKITMHTEAQIERIVSNGNFRVNRANAAKVLESVLYAGYQTAFEWGDSPQCRVIRPTSPVIPRLRALMEHGLLGVMAPRPTAQLRESAASLLFAGLKTPKDQLRQLREEARKAGLVNADGSLTPAGRAALGLDALDGAA